MNMEMSEKAETLLHVFTDYVTKLVDKHGVISLGSMFDYVQYKNDASFKLGEMVSFAHALRADAMLSKAYNEQFYVFLPTDLCPEAKFDDPRDMLFISSRLFRKRPKYSKN